MSEGVYGLGVGELKGVSTSSWSQGDRWAERVTEKERQTSLIPIQPGLLRRDEVGTAINDATAAPSSLTS